ncbi:conserved Plasmodium protein, unknown function [Plasmodium ovale curtisi]|nr:conserved Plasmodium protein, unknown function [Plasmodium ovale curtisi]
MEKKKDVLPNRARFDKRLLKLEGVYRRNHSIHYYLKRDDIITALAEIRKGTSPFVRDECNRTALDLAIVLFMRKFHDSIFTSLIIDYLYIHTSKKENIYFSYNEKGEKKSDLLFHIDPIFTLPVSKSVQAQMDEQLRKSRALLFFIKTLSTNIRLKKYSEEILREEIKKLSFPYLYNTAIYNLFKIFSSDHGQVKKWNMKNPGDARKLVTKILSYKLIGNQLIKFMGKFLFYFSNLVYIYGEKILQNSSLILQYLLHMSFTLDNIHLFNIIIIKNNVFHNVDIFNWDELTNDLFFQKENAYLYYKPLLYARLKMLFVDKMHEILLSQKGKKIAKMGKHNSLEGINIGSSSTVLRNLYKDVLNASTCEDLKLVINKAVWKLKKEKHGKDNPPLYGRDTS